MVLVIRIKGPELFQVLKLVDLVRGLPVDGHLRHGPLPAGLVQEVNIGILPEILFFAGGEEFFLHLRQEERREFPGQTYRPVHDPGIFAADGHIGDDAFFVAGEHPLPGLPLLVDGRVPGAGLVEVVGILPHPVVGGEEIHVPALQKIPRDIDRGDVVAALEPWVVKQLHTEFVDQILKLFLQISDDEGDVGDPRFFQLTDLPFHHAFSEDFQKALRDVVGQGDKAGTEAGCHDHRAVHAERLQVGASRLCDRALCRVSQALCGSVGKERVDAPEGKRKTPGEGALGDLRMLQKFPKQKSGAVHAVPPFKNY